MNDLPEVHADEADGRTHCCGPNHGAVVVVLPTIDAQQRDCGGDINGTMLGPVLVEGPTSHLHQRHRWGNPVKKNMDFL